MRNCLAQSFDIQIKFSEVCVMTESQIFSHPAYPYSLVKKHFIIWPLIFETDTNENMLE